MAQKKAATKGAKGKAEKPVKGVVKQPAKNTRALKAKLDIEEEQAKKTKKQPVQQVKPENESPDASEDEEHIEEDIEDGSDSEGDNEQEFLDNEAEQDDDAEEEDSDDDDDDDDEEENGDIDDEEEPGEVSIKKSVIKTDDAEESDDDDDDDDEAPVEAPINKQKAGGIPKIPNGPIPATTPNEQVIFVNNLPKKYNQLDLIGVFTKFGPIQVISHVNGRNNACIAFETTAAATAALAAAPKALTLNGSQLVVKPKIDREELNARTVCVSLIGPATTKENLQAHFEKCGEIELVSFSNNRTLPLGFIRFASKNSMPAALKLCDSKLNGRFIVVRPQNEKPVKSVDLTISVHNVNNDDNYSRQKLENIFKKHGKVKDIEVICSKTILAFVTFETEEDAQKALALNGKTFDDLTLTLQEYQFNTSAKTILITNLRESVQEEDLRAIFSDSGEIESVRILKKKALVKFTKNDGFCKSFLKNEHILQGQPIFIEPNSILKHKVMKLKQNPHGAGSPGKFNNGPGKFNKFGGGKPGGKFNNNKRPHQGGNNNTNFQKRPKLAGKN